MTILSDMRASGVPEETTDEQRDEVVGKAHPHAGRRSQYSEASMSVRTRVVRAGSQGASEPKANSPSAA